MAKVQKIWQSLLAGNIRTVEIASVIGIILVPVYIICTFFLSDTSIELVSIMFPAISLEAFSIIFFLLSKEALPRIKKLKRPAYKWIYRAFWFLAFNLSMYSISSIIDPKLVYFTVCVSVIVVGCIPKFDGLEYAILLANEALWVFLLTFGNENIQENLVIYVSTILATAVASRLIYAQKSRYYKLQNHLKTISKNAMVDPLTGLLNRRGFKQQVESIWPFCVRNDYKVALMIIDIDCFKAYNDQFGHPKGDECLQTVAKAIRATAKRNTDVVCRMGGEEFAVFIQGGRNEEILEFADSIRKNVERLEIPHSVNATYPIVTVSIGLEIARPKGMNIDTMYEYADKELYLAKQNGRNALSCSGKVRKQFSVLA